MRMANNNIAQRLSILPCDDTHVYHKINDEWLRESTERQAGMSYK